MSRYSIKKNLEKLMLRTLCVTRVYLLTRPLYSGIGTIVAFHRVCPKSKRDRISANSRLEVTPEYLENIVRFFAERKYNIISLDDLVSVFHRGRTEKKFVVFTFDDGYVDILTYVYPIFKKHGAPFTVYVTTNFADRKAALWWYLLEDLILKNNCLSMKTDKRMVEFDCKTIEQKEAAFHGIRSIIMDGKEDDCQERVKFFFGVYNIDIYKKTAELTLSWQQIKQLAADPLVTIGAHTVNHLALNRLSEPFVKYEVAESKKRIESHINRSVNHFCYPFGTHGEIGLREGRIVRECGFDTATTVRNGNIFLKHRHYAECLPRAIISGEREGGNVQYLNLWISGFVGCVRNRFKRVVTF